jgi:trimeric autotransporter adhesin
LALPIDVTLFGGDKRTLNNMSEITDEFEEVTADEDDLYYEELEIISEPGHLPPPHQQQTDDPDGVYDEFYSNDGDRSIFDAGPRSAREEASLSRDSGNRSFSGRSEETNNVTKSDTMIGVSHHTEFTPSSHQQSHREEADEFSDSRQTCSRSQTSASGRKTGSTDRSATLEGGDSSAPNQTSFRSQTSVSSQSSTSYTNRSGGEVNSNYNSASRTTSYLSHTTATSTSSRSSVSTTSRRSYTDTHNSNQSVRTETNHSNQSANSSSQRSYIETNHDTGIVSNHSRMSSILEDQITNEASRSCEQSTAMDDSSDQNSHLQQPDPSAHVIANGMESISAGFPTNEIGYNNFSNQIEESRRTNRSSDVDESIRSRKSQKSASLSNRTSVSGRSSAENNENSFSCTGSRRRRPPNSQDSGTGMRSNVVSDHPGEIGASSRTGSASRSIQTEDDSKYSSRSETNRSSTGRHSNSTIADDLPSRLPHNDGQRRSSPGSLSYRSTASSAIPVNLTSHDASSSRMRTSVSSQLDDVAESLSFAQHDEETPFQASTSSQRSISHDIPSYGQESSAATNGEYRHEKGVDTVKSLAILGTMSDAGKSVIVTAICRILVNGRTRVAPFKAQNMSNNASPALLPDPKRKQNLYRFFEKVTKQRLSSSTPTTTEGYGGEKSVVASI